MVHTTGHSSAVLWVPCHCSTGYLVFFVLISAHLLGPRDCCPLCFSSQHPPEWSLTSTYATTTVFSGGYGGSITQDGAESTSGHHANGSKNCLNPKALSCKDTHTQRRSGCSLQRACSPLPRFGGYAGTHDAAGCQHQSRTSFWKKKHGMMNQLPALHRGFSTKQAVPEGGLRKLV